MRRPVNAALVAAASTMAVRWWTPGIVVSRAPDAAKGPITSGARTACAGQGEERAERDHADRPERDGQAEEAAPATGERGVAVTGPPRLQKLVYPSTDG